MFSYLVTILIAFILGSKFGSPLYVMAFKDGLLPMWEYTIVGLLTISLVWQSTEFYRCRDKLPRFWK